MFTIILFIIILSLLVLIHEFGHFIAAKKNDVYVEEFGLGLPPRLFGIKYGETLYSINMLPFGGFVKVLGEEEHELLNKPIPKELKNRTFVSKKPIQKIFIIANGVIFNFILGWVIISFLLTQGIPSLSKNVKVEKVTFNSPAYIAGLKENDIIKKFSYKNLSSDITDPKQLVDLANKYAGQTIILTISRNDSLIPITLIPRLKPPKNQGALGIAISNIDIKKYSFWQAPFYGLIESGRITYLTARELSKVIFKLITFQKQQVEVAGPIGIVSLTKEAAQYGYLAVLQLISLLSINLAIINILPFPALDGGRLSMILYEAITKKKLNPNFERRLNFTGFFILIFLIILITINDIVKLFN